MEKSKFTILLIDDDEDLLATLGDYLRFSDYNVVPASSAEQGLAVLEKTNPDLIILDISMPGMGGVGFMSKLWESGELRDVPILILTARSNMEAYFADIDVAGFVAKPCDQKVLLAEIRKILRSRSPLSAASCRDSGKKKILLVENEKNKQQRIVNVFRNAGFEVVIVANSVDVIEKAILEKPDILIIKQILPKINGDRIASLLGQIPSIQGTPIILYADEESKISGEILEQSVKSVSHFMKSDEPNDLLAAVRNLL